MITHWPHIVACCCLCLYKTGTEDICTAALWMFEDVTVGRSAVYSLWFQLISWHLAQGVQKTMFEATQNKLKWPPRLLRCTTNQQATDNAIIYSKPTLESRRGFGCPVPAISLTGITFLQLKGRPGPQLFVCKAVTYPRHGCCASSLCTQDSQHALALCMLPVAVLVYWCLTQADIQLPSHMFTYTFCAGCSRGYGGAQSQAQQSTSLLQGCSAYRSDTWKKLQQLST